MGITGLLLLVALVVGGLLFLCVGVRGMRAARPDDDWAPIEAAVGRKFLDQTGRSRREWVPDGQGRRHLVEVIKIWGGLAVRVDGKEVRRLPRGRDMQTALAEAVAALRADDL